MSVITKNVIRKTLINKTLFGGSSPALPAIAPNAPINMTLTEGVSGTVPDAPMNMTLTEGSTSSGIGELFSTKELYNTVELHA